MILIYLILGHLLADFVLQPHALIRLKERSFWGVILHALVHIVITSLLMWPFLEVHDMFRAILVIGVLHAVIDEIKIALQQKTKRFVWPFIVDQFFHLAVIFGVWNFYGLAGEFFPVSFPYWIMDELYNTPKFPPALSILIVATMMYDLVRFQFQREKQKNAVFRVEIKTIGTRIFLASLLAFLITLL